MRKMMAAVTASAMLVGGVLAGAAIAGTSAVGNGGMPHHLPGPFGGLDALVEDGRLTQAQADAVAEALREAIAARIESGERPEDPAAFFEGILDALVDAGTISHEQAEAILETRSGHHARRGGMVLEEAFDRLVEEGTVTEEQVEAIKKSVREVIAERIRQGEHLLPAMGPGRGGMGQGTDHTSA